MSNQEALWASIMNDPNVDEIGARLKDGRTLLRWKYADGPNHYRWFDFQK